MADIDIFAIPGRVNYEKISAPLVLTPDAAMEQVLTLTTPSLDAGLYFVLYSFELLIGTKAKDVLWKMTGDLADANAFSLQAESGSAYKNRLYGYPKELSAGVLTIGLEMQCVATACTVTHCDIMAIRMT